MRSGHGGRDSRHIKQLLDLEADEGDDSDEPGKTAGHEGAYYAEAELRRKTTSLGAKITAME